MQETRMKIDPQNLERLKQIEQKKMISMQLLGMTVHSFDKTKKKIETEIEKTTIETEETIRNIAIKNNVDGKEGWSLKDIDFKNGEIVIVKKDEGGK